MALLESQAVPGIALDVPDPLPHQIGLHDILKAEEPRRKLQALGRFVPSPPEPWT